MFIKITKSYRDIVAVCDSSILGKKFEQGNLQLDLKESFYKGEEVQEENLRSLDLLFLRNKDRIYHVAILFEQEGLYVGQSSRLTNYGVSYMRLDEYLKFVASRKLGTPVYGRFKTIRG